jgi:hypothetical protein
VSVFCDVMDSSSSLCQFAFNPSILLSEAVTRRKSGVSLKG